MVIPNHPRPIPILAKPPLFPTFDLYEPRLPQPLVRTRHETVQPVRLAVVRVDARRAMAEEIEQDEDVYRG